MDLLSYTRKRQILSGSIYILLIIVLTWRPPFLGFIHLTEDLRFNMSLVFMWLAISALGLYISMTINLWIGLFLCYSTYLAASRPSTDSGAALLSVILGSIMLLVFYNIHNKNAVIAAFVLFSFGNLVFIIAQLKGLDLVIDAAKGVYLPDGQMRMGVVDCRNSLSAAFAFCFPVFFDPNNRKLYWGIPFVIIGLILAKTVGGVLAITPTLAYFGYLWFAKKAIIVGIIILLAVVGYIKYIDKPDTSGRWQAWKLYAELIQRPLHPKLTGAGLGQWKNIFGYKDPKTGRCIPCEIIAKRGGYAKPIYYQQAHSEFIQVDLEMGHIGLGLVVGYIISVLKRIRRIKDPRPALILLSVIIMSGVYFPMHIPILAICVILGISWLEQELNTIPV